MQIPKQQIVDMLRDRSQPGDNSKADQAEQELPHQVDPEDNEHQNLLQRIGIEPQQLMSQFGSGGI